MKKATFFGGTSKGQTWQPWINTTFQPTVRCTKTVLCICVLNCYVNDSLVKCGRIHFLAIYFINIYICIYIIYTPFKYIACNAKETRFSLPIVDIDDVDEISDQKFQRSPYVTLLIDLNQVIFDSIKY